VSELHLRTCLCCWLCCLLLLCFPFDEDEEITEVVGCLDRLACLEDAST